MQFPEINIVQQGFWNPKYAPEKTPLRFVLYYELEIHRECGVKSVINGGEMDCFDGLVSFSKPGDLRYSSRPKTHSFQRDFVRFELAEDPGGLFGNLLKKTPSFFKMDETVERLWTEFLAFYRERSDELKALQAHMALYSLLIHMTEQGSAQNVASEQPSAHQQALFETICFMREHLNENLAVGDIAHHIGYSTSHFSHLFKTYTKTTPYSYYLSLRLAEARRLLLNTSLSISQIADALAFGNAGKFSSAFKGEYHITPGQFRKLYASGTLLID